MATLPLTKIQVVILPTMHTHTQKSYLENVYSERGFMATECKWPEKNTWKERDGAKTEHSFLIYYRLYPYFHYTINDFTEMLNFHPLRQCSAWSPQAEVSLPLEERDTISLTKLLFWPMTSALSLRSSFLTASSDMPSTGIDLTLAKKASMIFSPSYR